MHASTIVKLGLCLSFCFAIFGEKRFMCVSLIHDGNKGLNVMFASLVISCVVTHKRRVYCVKNRRDNGQPPSSLRRI